MALLTGTSFTGVKTNRGNPRGPIVATDLSAVAKDNALNFEIMTDLKADESGGAPGTDGHAHGLNDGAGNLIFLPLATQNYGPDVLDPYQTAGGFATGTISYQQGIQINETSTTSVGTTILTFQPFWVPPGFESSELLVIIEAYSNYGGIPRFLATLSTWGATSPPSSAVYATETPVTGSEHVVFNRLTDSIHGGIPRTQNVVDGGLFGAIIVPAASGLHTIKIEAALQPFDYPVQTTLRNMSIVAVLAVNQLPVLTQRTIATVPEAFAGSSPNYVTVGDPDGASTAYDFEPVDDSIVATDDPMGPVLSMNNRNSALIEEFARGLPASGNSALSVPGGHAHVGAGAAPRGKKLQLCLGSWALGSSDSGFAEYSSLGRCFAPLAQDTTATPVFLAAIHTPQWSSTTDLYGAILVRTDAAKSDHGIWRVASSPGADNSYTAVITYTGSNPGGNHQYQLITSATQLTSQSGGVTGFYIDQKATTAPPDGRVALMGACFFISV